MPINLPSQPTGVNLPHPPQDSPTLEDVITAKEFQRQVVEGVAALNLGSPTEVDAARADIYKTQVIVAHDPIGVAPAWFHPAVNQAVAQTLPQALAQVLPRALEQVLPQALAQALVPVKTTAAQARNTQLCDGRFNRFVLVPFRNGEMPDQAPHNLPPLLTADSIRNLTAAEAAAYANGYGLEPIHPGDDRKKAIGRHIGCTADI